MKRNLALLLSMIALFLCLYFLSFSVEKEGILKGNKIENFLYVYKLNEREEELSGYYIKDKEIYYLLKKENSYQLYKRDINKEKSSKIKSFANDSDCTLVNDYIECTNEDKKEIYSYEYEKLYETNLNNSDNYPKIIKYKDTFLKYTDNKLYLNQKDKEKLFRSLPEELNEAFIEDYYTSKNNSYLLLFNIDKNIHYIYDISKNEYKEIISKNSYKYENGFYFYDKNTYKVINLKENKEQEFSNYLETEYYFTSYLKDNTLYYFNIVDNEISILDLNKSILKKISLDITKDNNLSNISLYKDYLYFEIGENIGNIYLIDLKNIKYEEINIAEEKQKEEEKLTNIINRLKSDYNINIHIKKETDIKYPDFNAEVETNNLKIEKGLKEIEGILQKYNKDFFDSFYFEKYEGLHIYLTSKLTPSNLENQISNPAAYSLLNNYKFMIVIDLNQPNISELLCHELIHNTEFALNKKSKDIFNEWNKYNPEDFSYNNSYTKEYIYNYTINEENKENIYFIDKYSHTYATEDRARIFENICSCNENSIIKNYPNIYKKALYLEEEIYTYYPSLKETNLFSSLK